MKEECLKLTLLLLVVSFANSVLLADHSLTNTTGDSLWETPGKWSPAGT